MPRLFLDRNNLRNEYSGEREISDSLRHRLKDACGEYLSRLTSSASHSIPQRLRSELRDPHLQPPGILEVIGGSEYDNVFHVTEMLVDLMKTASRRENREDQAVIRDNLIDRLQEAFRLSGSVYQISRRGRVELKIDRKTSENLERARKILSKEMSERFFDSVGGLLSRKEKPENVIKDAWIVFEDFLKSKTGAASYSKAVKMLRDQGSINKTQEAILGTLMRYRSKAKGVAHPGDDGQPGELDALWFLDLVSVQVVFLNSRLKSSRS